MRGKVFIIPSDEIGGEIWNIEVYRYHTDILQKFSDKYKLGYKFNPVTDFYDAPCEFALIGNFIIETSTDSVVCYIPDVVSDRQLDYVETNLGIIAGTGELICANYDIKKQVNENETYYGSKHLKTKEDILELCRQNNKIKKRGK